MTFSNEEQQPSPCRLKTELARSWRTPRLISPKLLIIHETADAIEQKFGGAPREPTPPKNVLDEVDGILAIGGGDISRLDWKQRKAVPYVLWDSEHRWSENERLIEDYLSWANDWATAPRRLWRHYLLNLQPASLATQHFARWLDTRADKLTPPLRDFSMHWELFHPQRAIIKIADSLLDGSHLIDEVVDLRVDREKFLKSACLLSILENLGQRLRDYSQSSDIPNTLRKLLTSLGENPIHKMQGHNGLGEAAQKSLVEGLVIWARRQSAGVIDQTLDLLHTLIGDPRLYPARWIAIDPDVRQTVEWWLTKKTLEAFFEVFRIQNAVNPRMVAEREAFWRGYMKKISRAWLISGLNGRDIAERFLGKSFGEFSGGVGATSDHLGLMLQIGSYVILEMNQNGSTLFWQTSDTQMPDFFQPKYQRGRLIELCSQAPGRFRMTHHHGWQFKYENEILRRTGVSRSS